MNESELMEKLLVEPSGLLVFSQYHYTSLMIYCFSLRLYVNWRFMRGIEAQFLALQKGFNELIPQHLLKPFDNKELEVPQTDTSYF